MVPVLVAAESIGGALIKTSADPERLAQNVAAYQAVVTNTTQPAVYGSGPWTPQIGADWLRGRGGLGGPIAISATQTAKADAAAKYQTLVSSGYINVSTGQITGTGSLAVSSGNTVVSTTPGPQASTLTSQLASYVNQLFTGPATAAGTAAGKQAGVATSQSLVVVGLLIAASIVAFAVIMKKGRG
jgi:hypothetical protein